MRNLIKSLPLLLPLVLILPSCGPASYGKQTIAGVGEVVSSTKNLPSYIKKVAIPMFTNKTVTYGLEEALTLRVKEEFYRDGRMEVVDEQKADAIIIGDITRYILEPLTYDDDHLVVEQKLWVLFDFGLFEKDVVTGKWKEKPLIYERNLEGSYRFFVSTKPGGMSEAEAQRLIWDRLSRDILVRVTEGYGTVTGISDRKVPPAVE
ncbi:MAG: LPS assembly lipoprotein LptE [Elusimicrobiota bacterium]